MARQPKPTTPPSVLDALKDTKPTTEQTEAADQTVNDTLLGGEATESSVPASSVSTDTPVTPPSSPAPDFLESLKSLGFEDVQDETTARQRLIEAYRQEQERIKQLEQRMQEVEPLATYGREYLDTLRQQRQQPTPATPAAAEAQPESWWNPPRVDPGLVQKYRSVDQTTGELVWSKDTPAHVRADAEKYQAYIEQWTNDLIYNPERVVERLPIRKIVEEKISEIFGVAPQELPERLDITGEQRMWNQFRTQYDQKMFPVDPVTQRLDESRLTPYGETVRQSLEKAAQLGIESMQARLEYAIERAEMTHATVQQREQVQAKREQNRQDVIRRSGATGVPDRGGSETKPGRAQNENLSPGRQLLAVLDGVAT